MLVGEGAGPNLGYQAGRGPSGSKRAPNGGLFPSNDRLGEHRLQSWRVWSETSLLH